MSDVKLYKNVVKNDEMCYIFVKRGVYYAMNIDDVEAMKNLCENILNGDYDENRPQ